MSLILSLGKGPDWASKLKSSNFELICPGGSAPVPVSDYTKCNLAKVPAHAVVTRPESHSDVVAILKEQQVNTTLTTSSIYRGQTLSDFTTLVMLQVRLYNKDLIAVDLQRKKMTFGLVLL